jgi:hypothetical protein
MASWKDKMPGDDAEVLANGVPVTGRPGSPYDGMKEIARSYNADRHEVEIGPDTWVPAADMIVDIDVDAGYAIALVARIKSGELSQQEIMQVIDDLIAGPSDERRESLADKHKNAQSIARRK